MNAKQLEAIKEHGKKLNKYFGTNHNPVNLCKQLRRIENMARKQAEDYCNGHISMEGMEVYERALMRKLVSIFGAKAAKVIFFNTDPRGYALKLTMKASAKSDLPKDWGGYALIAPEINV